ncbi:MAG: 3-hydroxyacyl-ACP dehydratase FabZ family protein [Nitrososphaerales archaeon]
MRYLLIDRIQRLEFNKRILAIKNVALSEDIYSDHFFGFPVMPGALLIESVAQAGTALLEVSANYKKKALLIIVEQAKFRSLVHPGDQLSIVANMLSFDNHSAQMDGTVHVAERLVMNARVTFALKDAEKFYPPKTRHLMETIYDIWLRDTQLIGFDETYEREK